MTFYRRSNSFSLFFFHFQNEDYISIGCHRKKIMSEDIRMAICMSRIENDSYKRTRENKIPEISSSLRLSHEMTWSISSRTCSMVTFFDFGHAQKQNWKQLRVFRQHSSFTVISHKSSAAISFSCHHWSSKNWIRNILVHRNVCICQLLCSCSSVDIVCSVLYAHSTCLQLFALVCSYVDANIRMNNC